MRARLSFSALCAVAVAAFLATGPALAYYYPPTNVPPGPPPNYNQVDTSYFVGTPELPLPPPDTGGLFVYYDQGSWCVANHIYSKGNSLEQFHCCVLAVMDQPPTLGVNVFAEEFEFWGDTTVALCLKQNDRWGWIPWGDGLYEIWWDVTTREWKDGAGDPNDFMRFRISGCAIDFNLCSSDHAGTPFGADQIYLGANKTPLISIPGFVDTYPGIDDPYQSQAGSDPTVDPNVTIFTLKSDTPRSYNKNGLINFTDSYSCGLALDYGQRYAGTFAYEGNGIQFSTSNLCPPNRNPNIMITPDTSVFVCTEDSVMIWIFASDPDVDDTITVEKISGAGVYQPQTDLTPIYDEFYFHPDTSGVYEFIFRVTDKGGLTDQDTTLVTVQLNRPPELACPNDDSVNAGNAFASTDFSVTDPDGHAASVSFLDITPSVTNDPTVVASHVEWLTTCAEDGDHFIRLVATDHCGLADTCQFTVTVYNRPPELTCPEDDSVEAGQTFVSTDFSATDPDGQTPSVSVLDINPPATFDPTVVGSHVGWVTTSNEEGDYIIRLVAKDPCLLADTCEFTVSVIPPPQDFVCPYDDSVHAGEVFASTDFYYAPPVTGQISVTLCGVTPAPVHMPFIVESHVEWQTECADAGKVFTICLEAMDDLGRMDSCHFDVKVYNRPPQLTCPDDDSVNAGDLFISTDYTVSDPDDPSGVTVALNSVTPTPSNPPSLVGNHVEWTCSCQDLDNGPDFTISLVASDPCGAADTCEFTVTVYNLPPEIVCPEDDSVHAGDYFTSGDFTVSDPKADPVDVQLCGVTPAPVNPLSLVETHVEWQTDCEDTGKVFTVCLEAVDNCGFKDTCYFDVTVYNRAPELTCPDDGVINAGLTFTSNDFSATDPDGDAVTVTFLDIDPSAANDPSVVNSHVEWVTTIGELGDYTIRLVATDPCGLADTCEFLVTVDEPTGVFLCPDDDSVHAGEHFVSTDFTLTYPECDPSTVEILEVTPPAANMPSIVDYHLEWQTTCAEDGDYIITLMTGAGCSVPDTCWFTVTVYNRPPELACPDYGTVEPMHLFISTDFHFSDPDGDEVTVSLLGIDPPAVYDPVIVERHVEWQTTCVFGDYVITLVATDPCGLADTCEFTVTLSFDPVPDFYIWVYPVNTQVSQGDSVDYLVELNSINGYHESCSLYVSGLPTPPEKAEFDDVVMTPTQFTTMTVYTSPETDTGTYTLTVTGKEIGRAVAHSKRVYLKVKDSLTPLDTEDEADGAGRPETFALLQNQPNPFNPETRISYYLPRDCQVRLTIYNVLGQKVRTLNDEYQTSGMYTVAWNGRSDSGNRLSSGIYFYLLEADSFRQTKKMTMIK